jgi:hypothetical protein
MLDRRPLKVKEAYKYLCATYNKSRSDMIQLVSKRLGRSEASQALRFLNRVQLSSTEANAGNSQGKSGFKLATFQCPDTDVVCGALRRHTLSLS